MGVYGCARVSTARQAADGESLPVQRRKLDGYAAVHGWTIAWVFGESGVFGVKALAERLTGGELPDVVKPGDVLPVTELDRAFRSASDALAVLARLKHRKDSLYLLDLGGDVTGNGVSAMVFVLLSAFAQFERERLQERVREVKGDQRRRRRYLDGAVPFCFRLGNDGMLVPDDDRQAALDVSTGAAGCWRVVQGHPRRVARAAPFARRLRRHAGHPGAPGERVKAHASRVPLAFQRASRVPLVRYGGR